MSNVLLNDCLSITYDDQFQEMTQEELGSVYNDSNLNRWGIADQENHIMITVDWIKRIPAMGWMINIRSVAKGIGMILKRSMPGYKKLNHILTTAGGKTAYGFCYRYVAGEIGQVGMTMVIKYKKNFYIVNYYAREKDGVASHKAFQKILNTFSFSNT